MVARVLEALHLEHVLGVAQVLHQVRRDLGLVLDGAGEGTAPGLQDRVRLVPRVERHLAGVGVHGRLDRVAHVVDLVRRQRPYAGRRGQRVGGHRVERVALGLRVLVGGGVAVDDPDDPAVDDRRVDVAVEGQPGRDLLDPRHRVAVVEHLAVGADPAREQEVGVAELHRVHHLAEEAADRHPAAPGVRRLGARAVGGQVELDVLRSGRLADDGVVGAALAEVDPVLERTGRLLERVLPGALPLRPLDLLALGDVVGGPLVAERGDHAVAVGVDGVQVGPVLLARGDPGLVQLAHAEDERPVGALDRVAVDVEDAGHRVVRRDLLDLLEGPRDPRRVEHRDRLRLVDQVLHRRRGDLLGRQDLLDVAEVVGLPRGVDVLRDVRRLLVQLGRVDLEVLHEGRPDQAEQDRGDQEQRDADARAAARCGARR